MGKNSARRFLSRGNSTGFSRTVPKLAWHDPKIEPMLENRGLSGKRQYSKQDRAEAQMFLISFSSQKNASNFAPHWKQLKPKGFVWYATNFNNMHK